MAPAALSEISTFHTAANGKVQNGKAALSRSPKSEHEEELWEDDEEEQEWTFPEEVISAVDSKDVGTPDAWVHRHPELVRLTGRHPFNCEPPLPRLMAHGFLTPVSLHYVRNHGAVPSADFDNWSVEIKGLVRWPQTLTMKDLLAMPARTFPVTLVCAGNRRKEENMVKQTIGFSWGAAAVSTTVWKGVRLSDVLKRCGILPRSKGALFVGFEGAETLPGGGGSKYGTSLRREVAMDESCDVILAYEQNGKRLTPDHGFPIRMIIPGYIGGRMVKWLRMIEVTAVESSNHYHFNDNRVLPSHVDAEMATKEGWWYKPDYIINELNINSAITSPAHAEILPISTAAAAEPYMLKGYAYTGGGRKVNRMEVSLDRGSTWRLCSIQYTEKPTAYGKYWCWVAWTLPVDVMDLLQTQELVCRAWDAGMNTQPEKLTWNVMGMMNNCWFRIKIHPTRAKDGGLGLSFEHPTRPGNETGGWMVKEAEAEPPKLTVKKSVSLPLLTSTVRTIPMTEVQKHADEKSAWIVVNGKVYDTTKFLEDHPGGAESILINAGSDSTEEFEAIHSLKATAMLEDYFIGNLGSTDVMTPDPSVRGGALFNPPPPLEPILEIAATAAAAAAAAAAGETGAAGVQEKRQVALNPKERILLKLIEKEVLSHDVRRFRLALPSPDHILGLPVGKHMYLTATVGGKLVMRAYTPTSTDDEIGYVDLVIKVYPKCEQFPAGGLMSLHMDSLAIGHSIQVKGPTGHIHYLGKGAFTVNGKPRSCKKVVMIAGGTGITPMYQVLQAIVKDPEDETQVYLIDCNRTEEDILLRGQLDKWVAENENVHLWHVVGAANDTWQYSTGHLTLDILKEHAPMGGEDVVAFLCAPPPMIKFACLPNLEQMKYAKESIYTF